LFSLPKVVSIEILASLEVLHHNYFGLPQIRLDILKYTVLRPKIVDSFNKSRFPLQVSSSSMLAFQGDLAI
jgi:hypothetical protein